MDPVAADDIVLPFQIEGMNVRGRCARLGTAVDTILHRHDYPESVSRMLGEAIGLTALLGCALKFDGIFSLQTSGNGPVTLMVVDYATPGTLRGYARFDSEKVWAREEAGSYDVPSLLGEGHLALTVDQGPHTERYQGVVALEGSTLAACVNEYFRVSEQIPTEVAAASGRAGDSDRGGGWRVGAALIQHLPEAGPEQERPVFGGDAEQENWNRALTLFQTVSADELTDPALAPGRLIYRLFHEDGVRVFAARPVTAGCRCSRERVAEVLARLPADELEDAATAGLVEITCDFCNTRYQFELGEISSD
jgi:molecular chaperone Hsp33